MLKGSMTHSKGCLRIERQARHRVYWWKDKKRLIAKMHSQPRGNLILQIREDIKLSCLERKYLYIFSF